MNTKDNQFMKISEELNVEKRDHHHHKEDFKKKIN